MGESVFPLSDETLSRHVNYARETCSPLLIIAPTAGERLREPSSAKAFRLTQPGGCYMLDSNKLVAIEEIIMAFPDRIERTLQLTHPQERVWAALTTAEGLGTWFGHKAEIDLRVGGKAKLTWDSGDVATLTIEKVEPMSTFAYSWSIYGLPEDDPRRNLVEFTLEPTDTGTTLTMVESGFAQLPDADEHKTAFGANTDGWTHELGELVAYLDGKL